MDSELTIRPARDDETDHVAALLVDAYAEYAVHMSPDAWSLFAQDIGNVRGRRLEADVLVAERGGRIVGSVTVFSRNTGVTDDTVGVRLLAVRPDDRHTGIGSALVAHCVERARAEKQRRVIMTMTQAMDQARDVAERAGFVRESALDHEPAPGVRFLGYALTLADAAERPSSPASR